MTAMWTVMRRWRPVGAHPSVQRSTRLRAVSPARLALGALCLAILCVVAGPAAAVTLPDGRAYEQVTPPSKNGVDTGLGTPSIDGNTANWTAIGGCCGASTSSDELFQSTRTASGWQTTAKTPTPSTPLVGLFEEQAPLWWSADESKTIYTTPGSYDAGDQRPQGPGATFYLDLYEQGANGAMSWLSQGPFGTKPDQNALTATFADATPDGDHIGFNTQEQLTPDATGLADLNTPPQFLYERNVAEGTTNLVNVTTSTLTAAAAPGDTTIAVANTSAFAPGQSVTIGTGAAQETDTIAPSGVPDSTHITLSTGLVNAHAAAAAVEALISPDGAILGNGNWLDQGFLPSDIFGTTTNAISSDGSKLFFESPPSFAGGSGGAEGVGPAHLYMRDESTSTTTPLDNPSSTGSGQYEGASQDGSLVFFTSNEGLGANTNTDNELYVFNTTGSPIGKDANGQPVVPAMSAVPVSGGSDGTADGNVLGVTAISNDGSHVYFVAEGRLAINANSQGATATLNQPNLYVFDTTTGATTFIATLSSDDAAPPVGASSSPSGVLIGEPDISRPAIPTPDGTVLAFDSNAPITNNADNKKPQNPQGPVTTLTAQSLANGTSISVADSSGFTVHRIIHIQTATVSEYTMITAVPNSTTLDVKPLTATHFAGDKVTQVAAYEIYRYDAAEPPLLPNGDPNPKSLTCVSCTPEGQTPIGSATFGGTAGGTYQPAGQSVAMNSTGTQIFFDTPDPLVPQDLNTGPFLGGFGSSVWSQDVYEWENGARSLISDGTSPTGAILGGTTPSGNDVFITTMAQLVPQDTDGYDDIYDARAGGGFPVPASPGSSACGSAETCRTSVAPTVFFPIPSSSTLIAPHYQTPAFTVSSISARQRKRFAKTGKLTLKVSANASGKVAATVLASLRGLQTQVAYASLTFVGTTGGNGRLTLRLAKAARKALANKHKLALAITVTYSQSNMVDVATLKLKKKGAPKKKHAGRAAATRVDRGRVKGA